MGKKPFKPYEDRRTDEPFLESDADEQLLMHIPFNEAVSIKSFCFVGHGGGKAPRNIKIWVKPSAHDLDFDSAEEKHSRPRTHTAPSGLRGELLLPCRQEGQVQHGLKRITLFISHNYGAETTRINFIGLKGEKGFGQRRAVHAVYEVALVQVTPNLTPFRIGQGRVQLAVLIVTLTAGGITTVTRDKIR